MHISAKEGWKGLGTNPRGLAAAAIVKLGARAPIFGTFKCNDLEQRSDPRLLRLPRNLVRCAVIFSVVALHASSLDLVEFETSLSIAWYS